MGSQSAFGNPASILLTFSIVAEAHFSLSETNCVFPLANAIELFQLSLIDALQLLISRASNDEEASRIYREEAVETYLTREVDLNGLDANVLRSRCHVGRRELKRCSN